MVVIFATTDEIQARVVRILVEALREKVEEASEVLKIEVFPHVEVCGPRRLVFYARVGVSKNESTSEEIFGWSAHELTAGVSVLAESFRKVAINDSCEALRDFNAETCNKVEAALAALKPKGKPFPPDKTPHIVRADEDPNYPYFKS